MKNKLVVFALILAFCVSACSLASREPVYGPTEDYTVAILILPRTNFTSGWDAHEFSQLYNGFAEKTDAEIVVVAPVSGVTGVNNSDGVNNVEEAENIEANLLYDYSPDEFDVVVVIGGGGPMFWQNDEDLQGWLQEFAGLERPMAAVCSGVTILARAGLLSGKTVTTSSAYEEMLAEHGANYTGSPLENDGLFWTFKVGEEQRFLAEFLPVFAGVE